MLLGGDLGEHALQQRLQVGQAVDFEPDRRQRAAHVGRHQMEQLLRERREATDAQVRPEHDDRHLHAADQVQQVVVDAMQLQVAVVQLVVDGRQLLVARLDLLLRGLQLLVAALQFLVGRLHLLVGDLQFVVGDLLLFDHRLQVVARRRQFAAQALALGIRRQQRRPRHGGAGTDR